MPGFGCMGEESRLRLPVPSQAIWYDKEFPNMRFRVLPVIVAGALALGVAACSGGEENTNTNTGTETTGTMQTEGSDQGATGSDAAPAAPAEGTASDAGAAAMGSDAHAEHH